MGFLNMVFHRRSRVRSIFLSLLGVVLHTPSISPNVWISRHGHLGISVDVGGFDEQCRLIQTEHPYKAERRLGAGFERESGKLSSLSLEERLMIILIVMVVMMVVVMMLMMMIIMMMIT